MILWFNSSMAISRDVVAFFGISIKTGAHNWNREFYKKASSDVVVFFGISINTGAPNDN